MRAAEFLTESEQLEMDILSEGPLGSLAKGIGKAAGGLAKGVGAVAGGVAGLGTAFKKGYQSGKAVVSGDEPPATNQPAAGQPVAGQSTTQPAQTADPAKTDPGDAAAGDSADKTDSGNKQPAPAQTVNTTVNAPSTATSSPAQSATTAASATPDPNATPKPTMVQDQPAAGAAGKETEYSKALKFVKGLPASKQKDLIDMLQRNPKVKAAMSKTSSKPAAEPAAATGDQPADDQPQGAMPAGRFGQEMGRLAKPLAGADSETPGAAIPQKAGNRPQGGGRVAGQLSTDPRAVKKREQRAAKKAAGAAQPDLTDPNVPISAAIRQRQAQGLAAGYRNPNKMIRESFSLFRKQQ